MNNFDVLLGMKLGGGGGSSTLVPKTITANGTYNPADDNADGYSSVTANVPNTYDLADEGKVVDNGALVSQSSRNIDANGLYDTTLNNSVSVDVPNSYTAGDEGKVVSSGALVSQTAYPSTVTQNGTYDTTLNNSVTVDVPPTPAETKSVVFYDYDGTVLYSYTPTEFAALTEMPANPTHTGLTAQGWNWSLADAKTYVAEYNYLDIGQMYVTDEGKTRLYCTFGEGCLTPYIYVTATDTADIDWGDGTTTTVNRGTQNVGHVYASAGDYVISLGVGIKLATDSLMSYYSSILNDGNRPVNSYNSSKSWGYLASLKKVEIGTAQRELAMFRGCCSLQTITIPNTVTSIGNCAFNGCNSLTSVNIPSGVTSIGQQAFQNCYSLTSITMPNTISSIGNNAFQYCYSLTSLTLPPRIRNFTSIIDGCYSLKTLICPKECTSVNVGSYAYSLMNFTIPSSNTYVTNNWFTNAALKSVTIPSGVTGQYGAQAFKNCHNLTSARVASRFLYSEMFAECAALTSVVIDDTVTIIGSQAFNNCRSLSSVNIPSGVTSIGQQAFRNCTSLTSVTIPSTVTSIGTDAFQNCYSLTSVTIPSGVTSIANGAFSICRSLTSVTIPSGVTSIGNDTFNGCYSLTSVSIPSSVTSIGSNAFSGCWSMGKITINAIEGSISGAPWGAPSDVQIVWTG